MRHVLAILIPCLAFAAQHDAQTRAAVSLLSASSARIEFGDLSAFEGLGELSLAVTVDVAAAPATSDRLFAKWRGGVTSQQSFILFIDDTNELGFIINPAGGSPSHYGKKTTVTNVASGSRYRICAKLDPSANAGAIWVDGTAQTITARGTSSAATTGNVTDPVFIGYEAASLTDGLDGAYAEVAAWAAYIPDWVCEAYGKGYSPDIYQRDRIFYAPLHNTSHLLDRQGGAAGTNTNGTDAAHPSMFYSPGAQ